MGIKPIDLQTLFAKMGEVGKEQSHIKEQAALQQSQAARSQINKEMANDRKVTGTIKDEGTETIKDDESSNTQKNDKHRKRESKNDEKEDEKVEIITDPEVGKHVDLSG